MVVEKRYITEIMVHEITGFSLSKLRNDRHKGMGIPYIKAGRSCRYDLDDVITFMEARKVTTRKD